ncbi:MBL fold metallo-hydrolase [Natroniella sp. ANB-PHB2]|uniref:MBL fold metallo-hydrolase n=1 Tax=Natroniella sp. ANB-PHB2 TaxID=3384444 RepID=UPI0038D506B5
MFNQRKKLFLLILILLLTFIISFNNIGSISAYNPTRQINNTNTNLKSEIIVHFIDVGQGDSILIETNNKIMLIDGGTREAGSRVVSYLQQLDVEHLDIVIGTHPHADHIGGLIKVIETFSVGEVIDPKVIHTTKTFKDYLTVIDKKTSLLLSVIME